MANERAVALADAFAAANGEAVGFARRCSDGDWAVRVPGEEWTVGVVLHHVAEGHAQGTRWIRAMASGEGVPETAEEIDRANAAHAAAAATATPAETVALLEEYGARLEAALRDLTDEELDRRAPFGPAGGQSFATADLAPVMARHAREHVAHARAAASGSA
jgi:DinB family protein